MCFGLRGNFSERFRKIVKLGKVFVVASGPTEAFFRKFLSKAGVYWSVGFARTGLFQVRKVILGVYRSAGFAHTGLFSIREYPPGWVPVHRFRVDPSLLLQWRILGRVPVLMFCVDRSLRSQKLGSREGNGLPKRRRPVPVKSETCIAGGYRSVQKAETGPYAYFWEIIKGNFGIWS